MVPSLRYPISICLILMVCPSFAQVSEAEGLAIQAALAKLNRFEVSFKQETYSDFFDPTLAEGTLKVARPGKMRMDYRVGERKALIWDGTTCYEYDSLADSESRTAQEEVKDQPLVRLLLYGDQVSHHFLVTRETVGPGSGKRYLLRPRDGAEYQITIEFDPTWTPTFLDIYFDDGEGTRLWFGDMNTDPKFGDDLFVVPPPG